MGERSGLIVETVLSIQDWQDRDAGSWNKQMRVVRPQQLSCWTKLSSLKGGGLVYGSTQGLGTFQMPHLPADLNEGYPDQFVRKAQESSPVEQVIGAIEHLAASQAEPGQAGPAGLRSLLSGIQVVTFRNNLNKIFGTLVHAKDAWTVDACMHEGTLYLDIVKLEETQFDNQDRMTYYGYKFESVCTQPDAQSSEQPSLVDSTSEYAAVVQLQLEDLKLIVAAEIDLTEDQHQPTDHPEQLPPLQSYLELKVHKAPATASQQRNLVMWKWSKWWLQSFLAGVPTLVLGCRDDKGVLHEVQRMQVQTLPAEARRQNATWDAWQMLRFGTDTLRWFRDCAVQHPDQHLRFQYLPGQRPVIKCTALAQEASLPQRLQAILSPP